ncbi:DUF5132 domain-containing protein [Desulfosoma sp.]|uniref:DUF5132 domain-containing protein n=1 Tax=Desulfacinum infernum TaxID=35837 RepID=A0A832A233_9BACT
MKLNDLDLPKSLLVGVAVAVVAPVLLPVVGAAVRPILKTAIKGGILLYNKGRELVAEAVESVEDLTAEAKAEMEPKAAAPEAAGV